MLEEKKEEQEIYEEKDEYNNPIFKWVLYFAGGLLAVYIIFILLF